MYSKKEYLLIITYRSRFFNTIFFFTKFSYSKWANCGDNYFYPTHFIHALFYDKAMTECVFRNELKKVATQTQSKVVEDVHCTI